jgi:hypothetical protein
MSPHATFATTGGRREKLPHNARAYKKQRARYNGLLVLSDPPCPCPPPGCRRGARSIDLGAARARLVRLRAERFQALEPDVERASPYLARLEAPRSGGGSRDGAAALLPSLVRENRG